MPEAPVRIASMVGDIGNIGCKQWVAPDEHGHCVGYVPMRRVSQGGSPISETTSDCKQWVAPDEHVWALSKVRVPRRRARWHKAVKAVNPVRDGPK